MFNALTNFISGTKNKVMANDEVAQACSFVFTSINKDVIPTLKNILSEDEYFKSDKVRVLENLAGGLGLHNNNPREVIKELLKFFKSVASKEHDFIKLVETSVGEKVFPTLASAQELAVLKTLSDISSIVLFSLDLMYYIVLDADTVYSKRKVEDMRNGVNYFSSIVSVYINGFDKHVAMLKKVSTTTIKTDSSSSMMDKLLATHGRLVKLPILNGFINNPVYHIRLWFVDRDIEKYKVLKEKKKLIELKLLDLKLRASGKSDEKLMKQIEYYEDKIAGMEYELKELEGSD